MRGNKIFIAPAANVISYFSTSVHKAQHSTDCIDTGSLFIWQNVEVGMNYEARSYHEKRMALESSR